MDDFSVFELSKHGVAVYSDIENVGKEGLGENS